MIFEALVASILIGFIRKGSLRALSRVPIRYAYLFVFPFVMLGLIYATAGTLGQHGGEFQRLATIAQYALLLAAVGVNLQLREMWLFGVGTVLNFAAVLANSGKMPVSLTAARLAGLTEMLDPGRANSFVRHIPMTAQTRLNPLADLLPIPGYGAILREVVSVGDVLMSLAVFILIQRYMCSSRTCTRTRTPAADPQVE